MPKIRVVIADDHAVVREGVKALLNLADDIEVVGEAADGREAIARVQSLEPDVVLMDIAMPDLGGLEATVESAGNTPEPAFSSCPSTRTGSTSVGFLKAGVSGYVLKKSAGSDLTAAIRAVYRGGLVLDPDIAREAMNERESNGRPDADPYDTLTDREKRVLKLVAEGRSNKEAADLLGISVKTAMSHREHIMEKLDLHSRTELIRFAIKQGVIRVED